jgi:hypothetical protein
MLILNLCAPVLLATNSTSQVVTTYDSLPESELGLTNILYILLIVVGVILILLGLAILFRLKNM